MPDFDKTPRTREEALAAGYEPFSDAEERSTSNWSKDAGVQWPSCATSPPGTQCAGYQLPDGSSVIGFCHNGKCEQFKKPNG